MKNLNKLICLAMVLVVSMLVGCGKAEKTKDDIKNGSASVKSYQRVVSLAASSDEIIMDLLPPDRIAGITTGSLRPELGNSVAKAKKIKNTVDINSPESILRVQPDIVIIPNFVKDEIKTSLKEMGIKTFIYPKQYTFADIQETIKAIAKELGENPEPLIKEMDLKIEALQEKLKKVPDNKRKRVVYLMTNGIYANPESIFQDVCRYAGVVDAAMELGYKTKTFLSKEQMVKLNPDAILVADFNWDGKSDTKTKIDSILNDEAYKDVKAIKNKQVFGIPGAHFYCLSHYIINASEDIARFVYPELFR